MAVPDRRVSRTRAKKRRTHYTAKLAMPVKGEDGSWKLPHFLNQFTGNYK